MSPPLKLNLGCGHDLKAEYVNVDKYGKVDIVHDLETFPWPWEDDSVQHILLKHVLEHLGETKEVYLGIIKEIYRISTPGAAVEILVPHPKHDDFTDDPTHVRAITQSGLRLFSKSMNYEWMTKGCSNTPLAFQLDVDFEIRDHHWILDPVWAEILKDKDECMVSQAARRYNNVVREIQIILEVLK
jgi:predicted SAM-dependent methyltransferase